MLSVVESTTAAPGVPKRYREATLESYKAATPSQQKALDAVRRVAAYLTDGGDRALSAVLIGPPGVGKSHLAAAVCHAAAVHVLRPYEEELARHHEAYRDWQERPSSVWGDKPRAPKYPSRFLPSWVNVPSLVVDLKAEMRLDKDEQKSTEWARALRGEPGLVVLDDIGRERISEWTGELLYTIVNDRYEQELPTIATSNLSADELVAAGYWPAISRLAQDGALVEIVAPDHRLGKAASLIEEEGTDDRPTPQVGRRHHSGRSDRGPSRNRSVVLVGISIRVAAMIDRLRELDSAATPGPWRSSGPQEYGDVHVMAGYRYVTGVDHHPNAEADAALIAASRSALPKLLAIAEAARDVLENVGPDDDHEGAFLDYLVPSEQIEALRAALDDR